MFANTQAAGDGGWIWYAIFFREGKRLYADMHLAPMGVDPGSEQGGVGEYEHLNAQ